ncbi:MAG TPA: molybdate ABC transporter substrate-binding protein [Methylomirabilota bacterium]
MLRPIVAGLVLTMALLSAARGAAEEAVRVYAAGSLRAPFTAIAERFTAEYAIAVRFEFGASGLLKERLERGEAADVFASANMEHPLALARQGKAGPVVLFARNELCALARGGLSITPATLLDIMLDPAIKLGTSTPKADPSGDYAWEVFRKADAVRAGSRVQLEQKALTLTGGPSRVQPPAGTSVYAYVIQQRQADVFLTYCTSARAARDAVPGASVVTLPPALSVGADYGLTALNSAQTDKALKLVLFILSADGQEILARHGFAAPTRPGQ